MSDIREIRKKPAEADITTVDIYGFFDLHIHLEGMKKTEKRKIYEKE